MDLRYDRVFSVIAILEKNMQKWGRILPFYQNVQKEGIVLWKAAWENLQVIGWKEQKKNSVGEISILL